jgi:hypothetical protein
MAIYTDVLLHAHWISDKNGNDTLTKSLIFNEKTIPSNEELSISLNVLNNELTELEQKNPDQKLNKRKNQWKARPLPGLRLVGTG